MDNHTALAHIRSSKSPKPGMGLVFEGGIRAVTVGREGELFCLRFEARSNRLRTFGTERTPALPPYIERAADADDDSRYQTVYAKYQGAVAELTAGLHFTEELCAA